MTAMRKLLLIILDGVPYANWRRLFGLWKPCANSYSKKLPVSED